MKTLLKTISNYVEKNNYLAFSLAYMIFGLLLLIYNKQLLTNLIQIVLLVMLLACIKDLIEIIYNRRANKLTLGRALVNIILSFFALFYLNFSRAIVIMIFASYLIFNGLIKIVSYILLKMNKIKGGISDLTEGLFFLILGTISFFSPNMHMVNILYILGIYLILLGANYLYDYLDQLNNNQRKRRIRIALPAIIDALIPFSILQKINQKINTEELIVDNSKDSNVIPDLEIFVHVSATGMGRLGHVDLSYKDQVVSYGNYDKNTRKVYEGFGSGVVFTAPKNKYIKFCINHSKKTIFSFGIKLTEKQKSQVEEELNKMKTNLIEWHCEYETATKEEKETNQYKDYSSMLYKQTKAKFYKFKTGKYKTYFVLGTNCGTLVDRILKSSGSDILKMYGVLTPGTYYDFLEREYMKKGSNVVTKKIYCKENIKNLK